MDGLKTAVVMLACMVSYGFGAWAGHTQGYHDGQVDAINGTIKYELKVQKDGSSSWKEK